MWWRKREQSQSNSIEPRRWNNKQKKNRTNEQSLKIIREPWQKEEKKQQKFSHVGCHEWWLVVCVRSIGYIMLQFIHFVTFVIVVFVQCFANISFFSQCSWVSFSFSLAFYPFDITFFFWFQFFSFSFSFLFHNYLRAQFWLR